MERDVVMYLAVLLLFSIDVVTTGVVTAFILIVG